MQFIADPADSGQGDIFIQGDIQGMRIIQHLPGLILFHILTVPAVGVERARQFDTLLRLSILLQVRNHIRCHPVPDRHVFHAHHKDIVIRRKRLVIHALRSIGILMLRLFIKQVNRILRGICLIIVYLTDFIGTGAVDPVSLQVLERPDIINLKPVHNSGDQFHPHSLFFAAEVDRNQFLCDPGPFFLQLVVNDVLRIC